MGNSSSSTNNPSSDAFKLFDSNIVQSRVIMIGLDAAGKTTLLYKLKSSKNYNTSEILTWIPTIGMNVEVMLISPSNIPIPEETKWYNKLFSKSKNTIFPVLIICWDVGGKDKIRPLWRHFTKNADGMIFVVDSNDKERLNTNNIVSKYDRYNNECLDELNYMLRMDDLNNKPVLVYANKQDLPNCMDKEEVLRRLQLFEVKMDFEIFKSKCGFGKYLVESGIIKLIYEYLPGKSVNEKEFNDETFRQKHDRKFNIFGSCATTYEGVEEGMEWFFEALKEEQNN